ncbi:MAG: SIMPL domain-containing protein [Alphaproteobacteria bacterium]
MKQLSLIFLGLCIAAGLSASGYFISQTMYNAKVALNTAEAKGLAERRVEADRANWTVRFSLDGSQEHKIANLYKTAEDHQRQIIDLLKQSGFDDNEIKIGVIDYRFQEFRDDNQNLVDSKQILEGSISIETNNVKLVATARSNVNKLIAKGINVSNNAPAYIYTKLNNIKPEMLREATKNARLAANEFAENAGVTVGGIRSARQGNFYIRDAGESYGDTQKIEKDIRVVTTITFYLTDK